LFILDRDLYPETLESQSKAQNSSLVSNENFSEALWPSGWAPGNMSQNDPKTTSLMTSLTKNPQPQPKIFFKCRQEGWRSVWALEQLSRTIGGGAMALVRQPKTAGFRPKSQYDIFVDRLSKCWDYFKICWNNMLTCYKKDTRRTEIVKVY